MGEDIIYVDFEAIDIETYGIDPHAAWKEAVTWKKELLAVVPEPWFGHTPLCMHCGLPIKATVLTASGWAHESGRSNCLSSGIAITFAEPTKWTDAE